jgi:TonB-linked SusC/RagA family outer membrane protein
MKTYIKGIHLFIAFLISLGVSAQQEMVIKGKVFDPYSKEYVQDAIVTSSMSGSTATTDESGQFTLEVSSLTEVVSVTRQGYHQSNQLIGDPSGFTIMMVPLEKYGYNSENISAFRDENLYKTTNSTTKNQRNLLMGGLTIDNAIQGLYPGLKVINKSGMPGEGSYVSVRGVQSMQGSNAPLIILNGVPYLPDYNESPIIGGYSKNIFNAISINDIENITLLKGGEASMYGSIGSNGVLLIDTKKATDMETMVEFSGMYGLSYNKQKLSVLNSTDFKRLIGDVGLSSYDDLGEMIEQFPFLKDDPDYHYNFLYNNNTDWQEQMYRPAVVTDNTLRVKGGDAVAKYDLSVNFLNHEGTLDNTRMSRYSSRLNANIVLGKKMDLFSSVGFAFLNSQLHEQGMLEATNPLLTSLYKAPILSPYRKDVFNNQLPGYDVVRQFNVSNPLSVLNNVSMGTDMYDFTFNTGLNYNHSKEFKVTGTFGLFYNYSRENAFIPGKTLHTIVPLQGGSALNTARAGVGEALNYYANINSQYKKQFGDNYINAVLGYQALITRNEYDAGQGINTASDFYHTLDNVTEGENFWGYIEEWNWMNYYTHFDYTYKNLLTASLSASYDAASSTGSDATRWGLFPSAGLTWYVKNMKFLQNVNAINNLNIMAEYSKTGNSRMSARTSKYYYVGQKFRDLSGIVRGNVPNTQLKWESSTTFDLGLELTALNNRFTTSFNFYKILSEDVILPSKISPEFGIESIFYNQGTISNQGIELSFMLDLISFKDVSFTVGGNLCMNENKLESLGSNTEIISGMSDGSAIISRVGESVYSFYGYKSEGVIASQAEADELGVIDYKGQQFNAGDVHFTDTYGDDGIIDARDRTIIGSAEPDMFGGFFANLRYRKFNLVANFTYSMGNEMYNAVRRSLESMDNFYNQSTAVKRRWQTDGQVTDIPKAVYNDPMNNSRFSDRWIEDASFVRLSNLTLSYDFDADFVKFLQGGVIYVTGENLYTFTDYLGLDPVTSYSYNPMLQGFDYGKTPMPATVKFGFKLQF